MTQINPIHILTSYFFVIIQTGEVSSSKWFYRSGFPTNIFQVFLKNSLRTRPLIHLIPNKFYEE